MALMQVEVFVPTNNARPTTAGISARKITKKKHERAGFKTLYTAFLKNYIRLV
jgi:hypothetical protein